MMRKIFCLAAAAVILAGSVLCVQAQDTNVGANWKTQFTGDGIESNFTSKDIANAVYAMQPGDSVTVSLSLKNSHSGETNWYMSNSVVQSLEDSQENASGGAYTYKLVYTRPNGTTESLYNNENVGGEKNAGKREGLHEATDSLEDFFYLDTLGAGQTGKIALTVALDGETHGNSYQNSLAQLDMNFAVERVDELAGSAGGIGNAGTRSRSRVYSLGAVQTSDPNNIILWSGLALVCGLALAVYGLVCFKRGKGGEKG